MHADGHGPTGAIGVATYYNQMVKWALSFALSSDVSQSVRSLSSTEQDSQHTRHKEEAEGRIKTDHVDRQSLCDILDVCIDTLEYASHPDGAPMNIVTGQLAHPDVNADNAVSLGHRAMENVKGGWSDLFYCPAGKLVVTMDVKKNHVLVGKGRVYDQERIYARVIGLLACSREINFNDVLDFELAAYPPSVFNEDGKINVATSKSTLKHKRPVTISERNCPISDTMIYVSVLIWVITWPSAELRVYVDAFNAFLRQALLLHPWLVPSSVVAGIAD